MRFGVVFIAFLLSAPVFAKDLSQRLGVGYSDQFGVTNAAGSGQGSLPSLALRYYPNNELALGAAIGVDTEKDASKFGFMAKVMRIVFHEDNLNFYLGASAGLISQETENSTGGFDNDSGFDLAGFGGAEFFLPGLESLGFSFEAGVGVTSISSEVRFRTIGDHPLRAGMIFYF
jgi:hypothetical protein